MQDEATIAYVEDSSSYLEDQTKIINEVDYSKQQISNVDKQPSFVFSFWTPWAELSS